MSKVTCKFCKNKIEKENAYSPRTRLNFCSKEHFEEWSRTEEGQYDNLINYAYNLYTPSKQTTETYLMLKKQIDYYHKEYKLKYRGMLLSLKYYNETLNRAWNDEYGLGQVLPHTYMTLKTLAEQNQTLSTKLKGFNIDNTTKVVNGKKSNRIRKNLRME